MIANMQIRVAAKASAVPLWKVADFMGISEPTLYRKLRHELPTEEEQNILGIIERLRGGPK